MTEQRNGGHAPPAFAFMDEATPGASREGREGALGTSDDYTTCLLLFLEAQRRIPLLMPDPRICNRYINDAWTALNSQTDATDVTGYTRNTETGSTGFTLPACSSSSGSGNDAVASTSHAGTEEASRIPENDARIPDATGAEPWSTQYYQACGTTTVYDVSYSHGTIYLHLGSSRSIDHTQPSTSRAGMVEASAIFKYGVTER
ncbi:uncharacterized protein [Dermacentor andersoni]|uniref:uncharacterized protein isoform X2 n=1 Tax=Dermacentor andersoni TaxID=34620 RepID=UPI003B3B1209